MRLIDADALKAEWPEPTDWMDRDQVLCHITWFRAVIDNMPTIDPMKWIPAINSVKWIPVTERLPNSQETVIVSIQDDRGDTSFNYTACGWITTDNEYWIVDDEINNYVIAWMPLPEPWRGEEDEERLDATEQG